MNIKQKKNLVSKIYKYDINDVETDFEKLKNLNYDNLKLGSHVGSKIVNYYTAVERLDTICKKNLTFFDAYNNKEKYLNLPYVKKFMDYAQKTKSFEVSFFDLFKVYFGSVCIFKPIIAVNIYCKYNPTSILDFTTGWGGRMVGACSLNIPNYIGIDLNKNLKKPLTDMSKFLKNSSETKIKLIFKDALLVNYNKLFYDFVLTSPPYYNIELYNGTLKRTTDEWDNQFYKPLFQMTFQGLQKGGVYCLNIPVIVYENVCINLFGECNEKVEMFKSPRHDPNHKAKKEYIYIWFK